MYVRTNHKWDKVRFIRSFNEKHKFFLFHEYSLSGYPFHIKKKHYTIKATHYYNELRWF